MRLSFVLVFAAALVAAIVTGSALGKPDAHPALVGTVGPGYTIKLMQGSKPVKSLKAGTLHAGDPRQGFRPRVLARRAEWVREGFHHRAVRWHEDGHGQAEGGRVQVLLPTARV